MYCSGATCELFIWKIPQNVWVENLRNMLYQLFRQSTVSAPAQYISQFYTAVYYLPGLYSKKLASYEQLYNKKV